MGVLMDVAIALLAAIGVATVLWAVFSRLLGPGEDPRSKVTAVVRAEGEAPGLEYTVDGLLWLLTTGAARMDILIADAGMNGDARRVAHILTGRSGRVRVCRMEELETILNGK